MDSKESKEPEVPQEFEKTSKNYCYIIKTKPNKTNIIKTYIGYTVDPCRRLKQHNCLLKGGAKRTTAVSNVNNDAWDFLAIITSNDEKFTKNLALSIEWNLKCPLGKKKRDAKYNGINGKINSILLVLNRYSIHFTIYTLDEYKDKLIELKNATILSLSDFIKIV
jgi:predicted GIY-YIG superfamily endonuclease